MSYVFPKFPIISQWEISHGDRHVDSPVSEVVVKNFIRENFAIFGSGVKNAFQTISRTLPVSASDTRVGGLHW